MDGSSAVAPESELINEGTIRAPSVVAPLWVTATFGPWAKLIASRKNRISGMTHKKAKIDRARQAATIELAGYIGDNLNYEAGYLVYGLHAFGSPLARHVLENLTARKLPLGSQHFERVADDIYRFCEAYAATHGEESPIAAETDKFLRSLESSPDYPRSPPPGDTVTPAVERELAEFQEKIDRFRNLEDRVEELAVLLRRELGRR